MKLPKQYVPHTVLHNKCTRYATFSLKSHCLHFNFNYIPVYQTDLSTLKNVTTSQKLNCKVTNINDIGKVHYAQDFVQTAAHYLAPTFCHT